MKNSFFWYLDPWVPNGQDNSLAQMEKAYFSFSELDSSHYDPEAHKDTGKSCVSSQFG